MNDSMIDIDKVIFDKIKLHDIKYSLNESEYEKVKQYILNGEFKLNNIDDETNTILLIKYSNESFQTFVKISFYNNNNNVANMSYSINNDLLFSYLLSSLVINKETSHILLPIFNIDMNIQDIEKIIFDNPKFDKIKENIDSKLVSNICCLQIKENYFGLKSLSMIESVDWKLLLFQLIHTLYKINNHYPGFRHNNLTRNSIMVYQNDDINMVRYDVNGTYYNVPSDFNIKIYNFEKASIQNNKNPLEDIIMFSKDLMKYKKVHDNETIIFLKSINDYNDYYELLNSDYFELYHDNKISNKKISTNIIMHTRKIKKESNNTIKNTTQNTTKNTIENTRTIKQSGGEDRFIKKPYRTEANTPYLSNDQRETYSKKMAEAPPKREQPLLLEQKIYDTTKRDEKPKFPPTSIPAYDTNNMINNMFPYAQQQNNKQAPIQKIYNVNLANPVGDHTTINRIYEDVLPGTPNAYSAISVYERQELVNFLRNIMLENVDGEEMTITGGTKSILSYIKLLEINPYTLQKNPYNDLPMDFLIYRSSYPVRFNESTSTIGMAKSSMGVNMRIYKMSIGSLTCQNVMDINSDMFDVWRDIKYYNQVKQIVINKISPNFICPILYKIDSQSKIDWSKITLIKNKKMSNEDIVMLNLNQQQINKKHQIQVSELFNTTNRMITDKSNEYSKSRLDLYNRLLSEGKFKTPEMAEKFKNQYITNYEDKKLDLNKDSGKVLVLLTEAPTNNIIQWASSLSEAFGTIIKMISTGYHTHNVWSSVIFQLVYSFAVLQKLELYIDNFSLENNVYIKDLFYDSNNVGSWIYIINNIEYYVPNYGYLVLIDSKYNDIVQKYTIRGKMITSDDKLYKIYGPLYNDYNSSMNLKNKILQQFKTIINPDNFGYLLKQKGGLHVDDKTTDLLKKLYTLADTESDISKMMQQLFTNFMHNRLGTYLMVSEKEKMIQTPLNNNNKPKLMIWEEKNNQYQWVIFLGNEDDKGIMKARILCNNGSNIMGTNVMGTNVMGTNVMGNNIMEKLVFSGSLFSYPNYEIIQNQPKLNLKYDDKYIFETYNLDNL